MFHRVFPSYIATWVPIFFAVCA